MMLAAQAQAKIPARAPAPAPVRAGLLQRKCACGGTPGLDGERTECRKKRLASRRRATSQDEPSTVPPIVHEVLRSPGRPLDPPVRAFMEDRLGHNFSQVRVHSDAKASESARAVNALAYTVGRDVVFGRGQYAPHTADGRALIAHELAHVVQQGTGGVLHRHPGVAAGRDDPLEREASAAARAISGGQAVGALTAAPYALQRDTPPAAAPAPCASVELFTELDLPVPIPNSYFRGSTWMEKDKWKAALETARKGKCEAEGEFPDVTLAWDLGNPALGSYYGVNLNKNDISFDIDVHVLYAGKPCCPCFTGTASWSFNVSVTRKVGGKVETGKTKKPITGSVTGEKCDGTKCCDVAQTMKVSMLMGDADVTADISGEVDITGGTHTD